MMRDTASLRSPPAWNMKAFSRRLVACSLLDHPAHRSATCLQPSTSNPPTLQPSHHVWPSRRGGLACPRQL